MLPTSRHNAEVHDRGRNSAASRAATTSVFAARIEMPVVLRGGMLDDRPALVPAELAVGAPAGVRRRFGAIGWISATVLCAFSVYAVRDTMLAPLAQSDAPSSAWETKHAPGATTPPLVATTRRTDVDLDATDESVTGTTVADDAQVDHLGVMHTTGTSASDEQPGAAVGASAGAAGSAGTANDPATNGPAAYTPATTPASVDVTTSSTATTATPDTLGGHGANSGGGKGGSGSGSGSP